MTVLTDFGDLAVLLPISAVMTFWLLAMRSISGAGWWLVSVAVCAAGTAVLKMYFGACTVGHDLSNPSGHSSFSTLAFGALALVVTAELHAGWRRIALVGVTTVFVMAIAASRLMLHLHTSVEITLGLVIGLGALAIFAQGYLRDRPVNVSLTPLLLAVVVLTFLLHGRELRAEQFLHEISRYFGIASLCG